MTLGEAEVKGEVDIMMVNQSLKVSLRSNLTSGICCGLVAPG